MNRVSYIRPQTQIIGIMPGSELLDIVIGVKTSDQNNGEAGAAWIGFVEEDGEDDDLWHNHDFDLWN